MRSQARASAAQASGRLAAEITPVTIPQRKGDPIIVDKDEHPRATSLEALAKLKPFVKANGTITAGNASGVNDGAASLVIVSEAAAKKHGFTPRARVVAIAAAGVAPRIMGRRAHPGGAESAGQDGLVDFADGCDRTQRSLCQSGAGGAARHRRGRRRGACEPQWWRHRAGPSAGMSGARLALTATEELHRGGGRYALCTMCIGVGQGIAAILEKV